MCNNTTCNISSKFESLEFPISRSSLYFPFSLNIINVHSKVVLYICTCYNNIVDINAERGLLNISSIIKHLSVICDASIQPN